MELYNHETFSWTISKGSGRSTSFVNDAVQFGDGYEQIAGRGINSRLRTWDLQFNSRQWNEIRAIEDFLVSRGGRMPFWFTPEDTGIPVLVRTDGDIVVSIEDNVRESLRCTFKEWRGG